MEEGLTDAIRNGKIDRKKLTNWVSSQMTEKIKNTACMKALDDLRKKHPELKSGVRIYSDSVQLTEEDKKYQLEFENLVASRFESITDNILSLMLSRIN